jgi:hypothetical protein
LPQGNDASNNLNNSGNANGNPPNMLLQASVNDGHFAPNSPNAKNHLHGSPHQLRTGHHPSDEMSLSSQAVLAIKLILKRKPVPSYLRNALIVFMLLGFFVVALLGAGVGCYMWYSRASGSVEEVMSGQVVGAAAKLEDLKLPAGGETVE